MGLWRLCKDGTRLDDLEWSRHLARHNKRVWQDLARADEGVRHDGLRRKENLRSLHQEPTKRLRHQRRTQYKSAAGYDQRRLGGGKSKRRLGKNGYRGHSERRDHRLGEARLGKAGNHHRRIYGGSDSDAKPGVLGH